MAVFVSVSTDDLEIKHSYTPTAPVDTKPIPDEKPGPVSGGALCLSGGGFRAMLFHTGALWRLNQLGYLPKLVRVSSVSGGSITAGVLGLAWSKFEFGPNGVAANFADEVVKPILRMARQTIDWKAILLALLGLGRAANHTAKAYDRYLFHGATLQDLPDDSAGPRFVINASNVQSGALWRFMRPYMRDYMVGEIKTPRLRLALAVAASSAFPPFLSPLILRFETSDYTPNSGSGLQREPYWGSKPRGSATGPSS